MAFSLLKGMEVWLGCEMIRPSYTPAFSNSGDIDATGEKASICGHFWHPSGPGTYYIRRAGFRFGTSITKSGGSALTVSLQDFNLAAGPPLQPDETQDQTVAITNGDASFASSTWIRTGTFSTDRTVSLYDHIALVVEYDGSGRLGSDLFRLSGLSAAGRGDGASGFVAKIGTPAWTITSTELVIPNVVFECSDGTFGTLFGAIPCSAVVTTNFGPTSTPDEVAIKFTPNYTIEIDAIRIAMGISQDTDIILYDSDSNVLTSCSNDSNIWRSTSPYPSVFPLATAQTLTAGQSYYIAVKPTAGTTTGAQPVRLTVNDANHIPLLGWGWASNVSEWTRSDGGAWSQNSTNVMMAGVRVSKIYDSAGGGLITPMGFGGGFQS